MNVKSQQLKSDLSLCIDYDQPLQKNEMTNKLLEILGNTNCSIETVNGSKVLIYKTNTGNHVLLYKAITYLGNPHPTFKKRIQLPMKWKEICIYYSTKHNYDVSFIGIYHYDNHIIFADFDKTNYLKNQMNNSAAHVYINDLYHWFKTKQRYQDAK